MRSINIALALIFLLPASAALAETVCPTNSHVGSKLCDCNTGYAKTKAGKCELKRAEPNETIVIKPKKVDKVEKADTTK